MADRGLSPMFLNDLRAGCLAPLLERVKRDDTLHLAIRNQYINIYVSFRQGCMNSARWAGTVRAPRIG